MSISTCDLYDQFGDALRVLPPGFRCFGGRTQFGGTVVTVCCLEDNSRVRELVHTAGEGKVLVVDGGGSLRCALLGDQLAAAAVENQWQGVVIYGCVRDREALAKLALGIMALETTPRKSQKRGQGQIQQPIEIAGVPCRPGDYLAADADGIVLMEPSLRPQ